MEKPEDCPEPETFQPHDIMIKISPAGMITAWTDAEKIFGYSAQAAIGQNISMIFPFTFFQMEKDIIGKFEGGLTQEYQIPAITKDGKSIEISFTAFPIQNCDGNLIGISKIQDITHKKEAEEKRATLAAIVNSSDDAIISKTLNGIITSWNNSATKMFGFTEEEAIGKHISIIIPIERIDEETKIIESLRKGEKIDHFETVRIAKDGTVRNISLTVSPIKAHNGKIIGASKVARDITDRIAIENQRKLYTERLQELNNYKDEFMVMASHELKTPLTVILANLQILQDMMKNDPRINFIDKTVKQVNRLSNLITNLLDVSKIQSGKLELNPSLFNMTELVTEITNNIQQTSKNHQIILSTDEEKLMVNADRERIEQVILNILANAIKYTPDKSEILVHAHRKNKRIIISIHDQGIGIPEKDIENVFLRFYRVSGSASSFSGSGIGLYISSEIIKSHGGKIWAESKIGKGSVFYFSIPATH